MRLEEFVTALVGLVEPDAVHPAGFFAIVEVREPLVLALLTRVELCILERRDVPEQQVIRGKRKCVTAVITAVVDAHLGVVLVPAFLLGQCQFVPPLGEYGARQVIVQVAPFGHVVERAIECFPVVAVADVIEPVGVGDQWQQQHDEKCSEPVPEVHGARVYVACTVPVHTRNEVVCQLSFWKSG